jgi:hypothetical protein
VKFILENVWVVVCDCDRILKAMIGPYLKLDYTRFPAARKDWVIGQFEPVAIEVMDVFFSGGSTGGERANYYATHPFPSTAKKIRAARS